MRISKFYMLPFCLLVAGAFLLLPSCRNKNTDPEPEVNLVSDHPNDVVYDWNQLFLEIERYAAGYRPGPAPRAIAYLGLSDYEACISGMPGYNSISSMYAGLTIPRVEDGKQYHWPSVINASRAYLIARFFPNATPQQVTDMASLESFYDDRAKQEVGSEVWDRSKEYGKLVASVVWEYSKTDVVGHNHFLDPFQGYKWEDHYSKDGDWKPTFPGPGKPMGGVWGGARAFAIGESDKICKSLSLTAAALLLTSMHRLWRFMLKTPLPCLTKMNGLVNTGATTC